MDIDRSLDDIVAEKRKDSRPAKGKGPGSGPRNSTGTGTGARGDERRAGNSPYARPPPRSTEDKWVHDAYQGSTNRRGDRSSSSLAGTGAGLGFTGLSSRIEVVNLHYEVTPADLKTIFSQAGTLVQGPTIRMATGWQYDRSGRSKGEATMEFASPQQAKVAINKFDGAMTKGQTISIKLLPPIVAKPRNAPGSAPGSGRGESGQSLLSRIQGAPSGGDRQHQQGRQGQSQAQAQGQRGDRRGPKREGRAANPNPSGGRAKKGPANEGDLDKELDSFMNKDATAAAAGDIDMA